MKEGCPLYCTYITLVKQFVHTLGSHLNWIFIVLDDDQDRTDSGEKGELEDSVSVMMKNDREMNTLKVKSCHFNGVRGGYPHTHVSPLVGCAAQ